LASKTERQKYIEGAAKMNQMMKRVTKLFLPAFLGVFLFSAVASAHVTVAPKTSTTGAWETYTLKVPNEEEVPTVKVTVKVPDGLEIEQYQPLPGWNYTAEKDASGKVKSFTFQATGDGIMPGQFLQFVFVAKNPDKATKAAWDAYQYYKNGSIVEWTGDESSKSPHAITDIVSNAPANQTTPQMTMQQRAKAEATNTASKNSNTLPLILSLVAVVLSLVACVGAFRKK
jgi:uncharacterized protein YcnI